MRDHSQRFPIEKMAKIFKVARSGYYKYLQRKESKRSQQAKILLEAIQRIYKQSRGLYGSPRIHHVLIKEGMFCSRKKVAKIMRKNQIQSKIRKKWKPVNQSSKENAVASPNLLKQNFVTTAENVAWLSDITYVHTNESWLYVAAVLDLYSRKVVGLSMSKNPDTTLVMRALQQAICHRQPKSGLIVHSDRGCQYTSSQYRKFLKKCSIVQSMSAKGNCYDNAPMESFFHTLKTEHIFGHKYVTREQAKQSIFEYIEVFYNRQRLHSTLGYLSPVQFELENRIQMI